MCIPFLGHGLSIGNTGVGIGRNMHGDDQRCGFIDQCKIFFQPCELCRINEIFILAVAESDDIVQHDIMYISDVERIVGRADMLAIKSRCTPIQLFFRCARGRGVIVVVTHDMVDRRRVVFELFQVIRQHEIFMIPPGVCGHIAQ